MLHLLVGSRGRLRALRTPLDLGGRTCPYCREGFAGEPVVAACESCRTALHGDCWDEGGCTTLGCRGRGQVPPSDVALHGGERRPEAPRPAGPFRLEPRVAPAPAPEEESLVEWLRPQVARDEAGLVAAIAVGVVLLALLLTSGLRHLGSERAVSVAPAEVTRPID